MPKGAASARQARAQERAQAPARALRAAQLVDRVVVTMDALVGGLGCDSVVGNPLGNLVDGFLDRARVAEQMGEGMVGGMMGPNAAMMGQTMMGEGAANLGMFGPQSMGGGLDVNDFLAASAQYGGQDAAFAQMDAAFADAQMGGPNVADFAAFQQGMGPSVNDFEMFQQGWGRAPWTS